MFKKLLLVAAAAFACTAVSAQVTTVYSIDYTAEGAAPLDAKNDKLSCDQENGLTYTNTNGGWNQFPIGNGIPVENSKFYTIKIVGKASDNLTCNTVFMNWDIDASEFKTTLGTEWAEFSTIVQAQGTSNFFLNLQPGGWNGTINIKSVTVTTGDEGYDADLLCLVASNIEKKTNQWDNQLNYDFDPKLEHGTYTFAFDVYGDNDGKANVNWGIGAKSIADGNWKELWGGTNSKEHREADFDVVAGEWKHYEYTYTINEESTYEDDPVTLWLGVVKFEFGNKYAGTLYFDNVVLRKVGSDEDLIPNGNFSRMVMNRWAKGWQHTYNLEIANGPEHPAVTRTADANSAWFGVKVMGWGDGVTIHEDVFANLEFGDKLKFEYGNDRYMQVIFGGWSDGNCNTSPWEPFYTYKNVDGKSYAEVEITEALTNYTREEEVEVDGVKTKVNKTYNIYDLLKKDGLALQAGGNTLYEVIYIPVNKVAYVDAENTIAFNTNYAGKEGEDWVANFVKLTDARYVNIAKDLTAKNLTYTRTFGSDNWQALYVPYDMDAAEWAELGTVAQLTDATKEGTEVTLTWETVESGKLTPNTPYIFKPAAAGAVEFTGENKNVKAATSATVTAGCATLTGIYVEKVDMADEGAYALSGGTFYRTNDNAKTLKPFRIYLTIAGNAGAKVRNIVNGEVTGIEDIITEIPTDGTYYDIMGRKIQNPVKGGIYINGGKKSIIR